MTAATERKSEHSATIESRSRVSKALEDRIQADGEQVAHTLNPDRDQATISYPDPRAPHAKDDGQAVTPQSNAEIQMARRTDAGAKEAATGSAPAEPSMLILWGVVAVGLLLVIAILIALA
jgi:hypothetical protein